MIPPLGGVTGRLDLLGEFLQFLREMNALAVGVIIGAAIGKIVSSVVGDLHAGHQSVARRR